MNAHHFILRTPYLICVRNTFFTSAGIHLHNSESSIRKARIIHGTKLGYTLTQATDGLRNPRHVVPEFLKAQIYHSKYRNVWTRVRRWALVPSSLSRKMVIGDNKKRITRRLSKRFQPSEYNRKRSIIGEAGCLFALPIKRLTFNAAAEDIPRFSRVCAAEEVRGGTRVLSRAKRDRQTGACNGNYQW